jgi:hypothetical protein
VSSKGVQIERGKCKYGWSPTTGKCQKRRKLKRARGLREVVIHNDLQGVGDDLPPWVLPAALGALIVLVVK